MKTSAIYTLEKESTSEELLSWQHSCLPLKWCGWKSKTICFGLLLSSLQTLSGLHLWPILIKHKNLKNFKNLKSKLIFIYLTDLNIHNWMNYINKPIKWKTKKDASWNFLKITSFRSTCDSKQNGKGRLRWPNATEWSAHFEQRFFTCWFEVSLWIDKCRFCKAQAQIRSHL